MNNPEETKKVLPQTSPPLGAEKEIKDKEIWRSIVRLAEIGQMSGGLIHDLNNDVTVALAHVEMALREKERSKEMGESVEKTFQSLCDIKKMIERTLLMIRGDRLVLEKVSLIDVLESALKKVSVHPEFINSKIILEKNFDSKVPKFFIDTVQMERVFINLIRNAIQAMTESRRLCRMRITITQDDDQAYIIFHDNGPGLPEQLLKEMDPLVITTTRAARGGTGLGLLIVREILQAHGGKLMMANGVEGGAKFILCLSKSPTSLNGEKGF